MSLEQQENNEVLACFALELMVYYELAITFGVGYNLIIIIIIICSWTSLKVPSDVNNLIICCV